jgi:hypothetical protein
VSSRRVTVRRCPYPGGHSAIEYLLPVPELPADKAARLHPWMADLANRDMEGVRILLGERWADLAFQETIGLRDQLLGYDPVSFVERDGMVSLRLANPDADPDVIGTSAYVLPPLIEGPRHQRKLEGYGIPGKSVFSEFLQHFGGLAEDYFSAGNFIRLDEDWETFSQDWMHELEGFDEWKDSLIIYRARNGDSVILRRDGAVGWHVGAERRFRRQSENFGEFLEFYVAYRRTYSWPFDSYGP